MAKRWWVMAITAGLMLGAAGVARADGTASVDQSKCKGLTSPDAVSCTGDAAKDSATTPATDRQNRSGTSSTMGGVPANSSSGTGTALGGAASETQNQAGRESAVVYDSGTVRDAQKALKAKHLFKGAINGLFDDKTKSAVRDFQKKNDLAVTGDLDTTTLAKLGVAAKSY
jgi:hypothetical protein